MLDVGASVEAPTSHPSRTLLLVSGSSLSEALVGLRLFAGSYSPLILIAGLRVTGSTRWALMALTLASVLAFLQVFVQLTRLEPTPMRVHAVSDKGPEVAGYVASYLLPFLIDPSSGGADMAAIAIFFTVVAIIYVRSDMWAINPLLYVFGYRSFLITTPTGNGIYVIARNRPLNGATILLHQPIGSFALAKDSPK